MKKVDADKLIAEINERVLQYADCRDKTVVLECINTIIMRQPDFTISDAARMLTDEVANNKEFRQAISDSAFSAMRELKHDVDGKQLADIIVDRIFGLK